MYATKVVNYCTLYSMTAGNLRVVAAEHSLSTVSGAEQISMVSSFVANTAYDANTLVNDIAIIKVTHFGLSSAFLSVYRLFGRKAKHYCK